MFGAVVDIWRAKGCLRINHLRVMKTPERKDSAAMRKREKKERHERRRQTDENG